MLEETGTKQLHKEIGDLKHSLEHAKGAKDRGEYLRGMSYVTVALEQLSEHLLAQDAKDATAALREKVKSPGIYLKPEKHRMDLLSTRTFWKSTIKRTSENITFTIPTTSMKIKVDCIQTSRKNLTPDRDGETLDFRLSLPTSGYITPILKAFDTQVLKPRDIDVLEIAKGLLPDSLGGSDMTTDEADGGFSAITDKLTSFIGDDWAAGTQDYVRFDLRLKKINGEWRMLYARMMDDLNKVANLPLSVPVAATGVNVKLGLEASATDISVKKLYIGADTLEMFKGRYDVWKEANVLEDRWDKYTNLHEPELKGILRKMADPTSNPALEARDMIDDAYDIGVFDDRSDTVDEFSESLHNAVASYAANQSDENFQNALAKLTELLEVNSKVYVHDMLEMIAESESEEE